MSIDIDIVPFVPSPVSWSVVRSHVPSADSFLRHARLVPLGQDCLLDDDELLAPDGVYRIETGEPNTLLLSLARNGGNLDERDYVEDYGRNLTVEQQSAVIERWRQAGHYYEITTMGGRSEQEPQSFVQVGAALAAATSGMVIVMNEGIFDRGVGLYSPEEFRNLRPRFGNRQSVELVGAIAELGGEGPSLAELRGKGTFANKEGLLSYLRRGKLLIGSPALMQDPLRPNVLAGANHIRTDGRYAWHTWLEYFVKNYDVALPAAFLEHVERNAYEVPADIDTRALRLGE